MNLDPTTLALHKVLKKGQSSLVKIPQDIFPILEYYLSDPCIKMEMLRDTHNPDDHRKLHHDAELYPKCTLCKIIFADYYAAQNFYCKYCIDDFRRFNDDSPDYYSDYFSIQRKRLLCVEDEECIEYGDLSPARCRLCAEPNENQCQRKLPDRRHGQKRYGS